MSEKISIIASEARSHGFSTVDEEIVREFIETGSVPESTVSPEYDEDLEETLMSLCGEYGVI